MKALWFVVCFTASLASPPGHCPPRCVCSNGTDSNFLINCTNSRLREFPTVENSLHPRFLEVYQAEGSQYGVAIDLSRNEIVRACFPPPWKVLRKIDLSYNNIATLKNLTLDEKNSLTELNLSHNKGLETLTADLRSETLERLALSGCSIGEVEVGFLEGVPRLKALDVSDNLLTELGGLASSDSRDAEGSAENVTDPRRRRFHLAYLNVSRNSIGRIDGKELSGTKLRVLDVSGNSVAHLEFTRYLPHLGELYMSDNNLGGFHGMALPNVLILDISKNKLRHVPADLGVKAPKLKRLDMSHNPIERLGRITSPSVSYLDVSYCQIRSIERDAFSGLEAMEQLNLVGNRLGSLDPHLLADRKTLKVLHLGGNPWKCLCTSTQFQALYNIVVVERSYSSGRDLPCEEPDLTWSSACNHSLDNGHLADSKRGALYALLYALALLFVLGVLFSCYRCVRQMRQSATISFDGAADTVSDSECDLISPPSNRRVVAEESEIGSERATNAGARRSTPPPNYEAAIRLPELTEEQRNTAMSNLSLHRLPQ